MATIYSLIKIVEREEYAKEFLEGRLYMNTVRSFKEYRDSDGEFRGDKYEGLSAIFQRKGGGDFCVAGNIFPLAEMSGPLLVYDDRIMNCNVFCMYSVNSGDWKSITEDKLAEYRKTLDIRHENQGLGGLCVVITNVREFLKRFEASIARMGFEARYGLVDYFNEFLFHGKIPKDQAGFYKRKTYYHQSEFRLLVDRGESDVDRLILDIGDLSDIAIVTTPNSFNHDLLISLPT